MTINDVLENVLVKEGGYVNDPADRGGETMFGITKAVARQNGYVAAMRDLPRSLALEIYRRQYVLRPRFDQVGALSAAIGAELVDTGVNMGPAVAATFLQRSLNGLNRQARDYADVAVDGLVGPDTCAALKAFLTKRGRLGERRLLALLNALQGARYLTLAEGRVANETFLFGWLGRVEEAA